MAVQISVYGKADLKAIKDAQKELDGLKKSAVKNAGGFKGAMSSIGSAVTSTGAKIASGLAAAGVAKWVMGSIHVAQQMAATNAQLRVSVTNTGASWAGYSKQMEAAVAKSSDLSGFTKGELKGALSQMTITTGDAGASLSRLGVIQDLARAKGMSASQAAVLLGKAYNGNITSLKRLGIELPKGTKGFAAIDAVQKKVAGSAKAYGDTAAGAQAKFQAKLLGLQATIGTKIMPAFNGFLKIVGNVFDWFGKLSPQTQTVIATIGGFAGLAAMIAPFAGNVASMAKGIWGLGSAAANAIPGIISWATSTGAGGAAAWAAAAGTWSLNAAVAVLTSPITLVVAAIIALVAILVLAWTHCAQFRAVVTTAFNGVKAAAVALWAGMKAAFAAGVAVVKGIFSGLGMYFGGAWKVLSNIFLGGILLVIDLFTGKFGKLKSDAKQIWNNIVTGVRQMWSGVAKVFTSMAGPIINGAKAAFGNFLTFMKALPGKVVAFFASLPDATLRIGTNIITGLWNGISSQWHALTTNVGKLFSGLVSWIRNLLGIHSPSTVFASIGANLGAGLANGITGSIGAVTSAASRMAAAATVTAKATFASTATGSGSYGAYSSPSLAFAGAGASSSRTVVVAEGAVQLNFPAGTSASKEDIRVIVKDSLKQLADQIARR